MASAPSYSTVLVTGANAFYSAAIMNHLLQKDPNIKIHAAVRRAESGEPLKQRYGKNIEIFVVGSDITTPTAFNEAVKGCDAIFHVASPIFHTFSDAATEVLDPATNGALSALRAATTEPKVKRVVLTSSLAACLDPLHPTGFHRPGYTYTEKDWNPTTHERAAPLKAFGPVYTASKALAEKAAWDFMQKEKRHFDMVAVNPCHTWGRYDQHVSSPNSIAFTLSDLSKLMDGEEKDIPFTPMPWMCDIKEVAQAHVNALYKPEANGRYIIANHDYDFQKVVDIMYEHFPDADWIQNVPRGTPGKRAVGEHFALDNTRSREELGVQYSPWEQSVVEFCEKYQEDRKRFA